MAPRSDLLDHYKLNADQIGDSVIHCSYRSDRAHGLRKIKLEERWDNVRPIGGGSFGEVWQQKQSDSNEQRAVKILRKHQMKSWGIDYEREIEALAKFDKAQFRQEEVIVQFLGWWESGHSVHLAMEYFEMGDLSIFISEATTSEQDAKDIAEDLLQALIMIHSQGFTHRDLKPQNIFVVQTSPKYWVKLGDFGISKRVSNQSTALRTEVGTRAFSAPETTPDDYEETFQYTNAVDMWSLGCVIYNVLTHSLPYKNSHAKSFPFPTQPLKDRVNDQGINLLECLLRLDPSTRWTAQKAVKHPWLEASSEASSAAAEDAKGHASSVAQSKIPNENQDKSRRPDDQVDMPTFISSMEKACPKPADRTETPINQLASQSSGQRGKDGQRDPSSNKEGRRRKTSNMVISPSRYRIPNSSEDPGIETLTPRRAGYRRPKDASRGLHEVDTIKKPTASPVMSTVVSRPSNVWLGTSSGSSDDECQGATRGLHEGDTIKKLTSSPVMPIMVSRPSNIELGTSYSSLDDEEEATQKEPLVKLHQNGLMRRRQGLETQAAERMDLVTTLRDLYTQQGDPEQDKIARALELIREGVDLEMRSDGETALHLAVRICYSKKAGHVTQILHELLESGADVDARIEVGDTALHIVLWCSVPNDKNSTVEVVKQLLRYKANVNAKGNLSRTPLHYAAHRSNVECIDVLLAAGARINELDYYGRTALHWAVFNTNGQTMTRKLILAGININVFDNFSRTALQMAKVDKSPGIIAEIEKAQEQLRRSHGNGREARSRRPMGTGKIA